jgi:hypothetical protein
MCIILYAAVGIAMAAATFRFMQVAGGDEGFVFEFEASDNNNSGKLN